MIESKPVRRRGTCQPHEILPTAIYTVPEAREALQLKASTIRREVREGRLRISKRAGRYYITGAWLLEWIESGELRRNKSVGSNGTPQTSGEMAAISGT